MTFLNMLILLIQNDYRAAKELKLSSTGFVTLTMFMGLGILGD